MNYPAMTRSNARYRGPRESVKQMRSKDETAASIARLVQILDECDTIHTEARTEVIENYTRSIPTRVLSAIHGVHTMKGGEL